MSKIKIASRATPLALAQTRLVINAISQVDSHIECEIIKTITSGDENQTSALTENQNFFTKEIDKLVLEGKVDAAVHSLKDTGLLKAGDITQVAFLKRENPYDTLIFNKNFAIEAIKNNGVFVIGSLSPRRKHLIEKHIADFLPWPCKIKIVPLRGNVGTRISKISTTMQGIILAKCGLSRLNLSLNGLQMMSLPLSVFTPAPGQGIIAVECLKSSKFHDTLSQISNNSSKINANIERSILQKFGGGCHQKFGAFSCQEYGITFISGESPDGQDITAKLQEVEIKDFLNLSQIQIFDTQKIDVNLNDINAENIFIAHGKCVNSAEIIEFLKTKNVYTSGIKAWKKLAKLGVYVTACTDSLGYKFLEHVDSKISADKSNWHIFTNFESLQSWHDDGFVASATYRLGEASITNEIKSAIAMQSAIFWPSIHYYNALHSFAKQNVVNLCGHGKTADALRNIGIKYQKILI